MGQGKGKSTQTGLDRILTEGPSTLRGARVGLLGNPTTVDSSFQHAVDVLPKAGVELVALFGPEHGIRGDVQYMDPVGFETDPQSGLPVYSLYGADEASLAPTEESLDGLDAFVFDIQDVGARYYTYVWSMVLAARACKGWGVRFVVLDRPNPLGGLAVEGGAIEEGFRSFVGLRSVPNRHGMTAGEIATMAFAEEGLGELEVVKMNGWTRSMWFDETGAPWVQPSPNMPTLDTAIVYPGLCLLEGTNISEGRGTTKPFELVGAPFIDGYKLSSELNRMSLPGVRFRPTTFTPTFEKFAGKACYGVGIHVVDRNEFLPYATGVAVLKACRDGWPDKFSWRQDAYEFRDDVPAVDLLAGSAALRDGIDAGQSLDALCAHYAAAQEAFSSRRQDWLLYS